MSITAHALIIDDNPYNGDVLITLLEKEGMGSIAIESPRHLDEALGELSDLKVIFLDLEMPNYNGFEVLEYLKTDKRLRNVPIVAYTVHTNAIVEAREAGFHSFLGKPVDMRRFPGQLARILKNEAVWEI